MRSMAELFTSPAASKRRVRASEFLDGLPGGTEVLIVSASRGAADDVARDLARREAATFGLHRFSLAQLAAGLAATRLAAAGLAPATSLAAQAIAARAVFDARAAGALEYFAPVAWMPGFAPALARSLHDLRMADAQAHTIGRAGEGGRDLAALYDAAVAQFETGGAADRAQLFTVAREVLESGASFCEGRAVVLVDVAIDTAVERAFVAALLGRASRWLACVPSEDGSARKALEELAAVADVDRDSRDGELDRLRRHLFKPGAPPVSTRGSGVVFFSAPGEGREAVEVARYLLDEARRGVRFDEMAVLLRSPREYLGLLEHAFTRAGISASFGRGTRRPHPAGRALLALLSCADENLSANRFAEYLSLAQVPAAAIEDVGPGFSPVDTVSTRERVKPPPTSPERSPEARRPEPEADCLAAISLRRPRSRAPARRCSRHRRGPPGSRDLDPVEPDATAPEPASPDEAVVQGMVRAPYRWEEWLVESAVIAGRDRWRRLDGVAAGYRLRLKDAKREDAQSPRVRGIERDLSQLEHLRAFALPLIDEFDAWPETATWGEWLDRLEALVPRVIRQPLVVQRVLAELRPMAAVGPVSLREVREVLSDRLRTVAVEPPPSRYGRVFVGTADEARGTSSASSLCRALPSACSRRSCARIRCWPMPSAARYPTV